jgi:hypothetical protein
MMGPIFAIAGVIAFVWAAVKYEVTARTLHDAFPPQFQDALMSRYAFPVYALHHSTPLTLQADYVKASAGGAVAMLCFSLSCFSFGRPDGGVLALFGFGAGAVFVFKSFKTY